MKPYPFRDIEPKWQRYWEEREVFAVGEDPSVPREKRKYVLDMFPYPSAAGLHVGHLEGYTATDIYCRYLRMNGYAVLHPMGFDSFGLPAENYAIKTGMRPRESTEKNIARFRQQIKAMGFSYDWSREVSTHDPRYFRWTQWIFLQLYRRGLAYSAEAPVWYCPALGTVLANEEVLSTDDGPRSERGNHPVERRLLRQWMLKITAYAERLLEDLKLLEWPESIKAMQRNWIGKSCGVRVRFRIDGAADGDAGIEVFTTRVDTLFGATFVAIAPEHPFIRSLTTAKQLHAVERYIHETARKSDMERTELAKEKSGVWSGAYAINPVNGESIPIWIADYVLMSYGSGAVMAVPAHDQRDHVFAQKYGLNIVSVYEVERDGVYAMPDLPYTGVGRTVNSGAFSGLSTADCASKLTVWLMEHGYGEEAVQYRMRDWIFSRQRYWGEPIPVVHYSDGSTGAVDEADLPLTLPEVESYEPSGTGESPLAKIDTWIHTEYPAGSGRAVRRESNTMPQWAGSCWYYLRYVDPHNDARFADAEKIDYWMPVSLYVGGGEHAVLHLLYARFWHKVLYDIGLVHTPEPFTRLVNQGVVLGTGGVKMSKSLGNVVSPDDIINEYGADSLRLYEMFIGPLEMSKPWKTEGLVGMFRFLNRIWRLGEKTLVNDPPPAALQRVLHQTIKKVSEDVERLSFNTAIAQLMICVNHCYKQEVRYRSVWVDFVKLLSVFAPHIAEELWAAAGMPPSVSQQEWPTWDERYTAEQEAVIAVQVNGKLRATITAAQGSGEEEVVAAAQNEQRVERCLQDKKVLRTIYVPHRLVNFVVSK